MPTRAQLQALTDELRRLKAGGERGVAVSPESLEQLHAAVNASVAEHAAAVADEGAVLSATVGPQFTAPVAPRSAAGHLTSSVPAAPPAVRLPEGDKAARWAALRALVLHDPVCRTHVFPGKQVVFGVGNIDAAIMFVGEAPGADEEEQGEPFVGRAGQLLNRMIKAMGLERSQVYIGNILNWRPEMPRNHDGSQTGNRPPSAAEMTYCLPFIREQIALIRPRVVVALGKTAVDGLLGADRFKTMGAARGTWHTYADTPLRATYHPSYLLRQEGLTSFAAKKIKRDAWEDLLQVMEHAGLPVSEKQRGFFL